MILLRARFVLPITRPPLENGAVALSGTRIRAVGPWPALRSEFAGPAIDLGEAILLPGLINAHCHLDYTDLAGKIPPPRHFPDWIKAIVALKAAMSPEDYSRSWQRGSAMLLRSGTTTVADVEAIPELLPAAWTATPLRVISFAEVMALKPDPPASQVLEPIVRKLAALPGGAGRIGLSPHAPYTTTPDLLREAARAALTHHWRMVTHVAESEAELHMFRDRQGPLYDWLKPQRDMWDCGRGSVVEHLARCGYLSERLLAVHANYLEPGDADVLGRHRVSVVHCPRSHAYFKHARFPHGDLAAHGVNVCLGTDSLATTLGQRRELPELDLFAEMRALAAAEPGLAPAAILEMATLHGAAALGRERELGELAPSALADLIAVPWAAGTQDPEEAVLGHTGPVRAAMIDGAWAIAP